MILHKQVVQYTGNPTFTLYGLGDVHIGTIFHDRALWLKTINEIKNNPYALWIGGGDYLECITHHDKKRYNKQTIPPEYWGIDDVVKAQIDQFIKDVTPIKDKCIGLMNGNHEASQLKYNGYDAMGHILDNLNADLPESRKIKHLGFACYTRLTFQRTDKDGKRMRSFNQVIYATHGKKGGGKRAGSKINPLEDIADGNEADIVMKFHVHTPDAGKLEYTSITSTGAVHILSKERLLTIPSNFHAPTAENQISYGEEGEMPAKGCVCKVIPIYINPESRKVQATI